MNIKKIFNKATVEKVQILEDRLDFIEMEIRDHLYNEYEIDADLDTHSLADILKTLLRDGMVTLPFADYMDDYGITVSQEMFTADKIVSSELTLIKCGDNEYNLDFKPDSEKYFEEV